jgi:hypothetical protein
MASMRTQSVLRDPGGWQPERVIVQVILTIYIASSSD